MWVWGDMTRTTAQAMAQTMTGAERARFEREGYPHVAGALSAQQVADCTRMVDELYARERRAGRLGPDAAMHRLSAVHACPGLAPLVDHSRILALVCSVLDWNVHVYHSHVDVHPPITGDVPFRFHGYTYRWVRSRDTRPELGGDVDPVRRQLLGLLRQVDGDHAWGHEPETVPLYGVLGRPS